MRSGLVIGKFMPLHLGHIALIHFAASQCDELIVSMTWTHTDVIPGPLRFAWIQEEFKENPKIKPELSPDDFDDESFPLAERMPFWADFIRKRFPTINCIYSSEQYGELLAAQLAIPHVLFDEKRARVPVSGSAIRARPFRYWYLIAGPARSFFVKKICFYGPESTGKSSMAKYFASLYNTEFVPEVSRELISSNDFSVEDIIRIGHAQTDRVLEKLKSATKYLFCDTDLITTQIYSRHYLNTIPPILFELEKKISYDQYFLFDIDVPWVADGLRDLGESRLNLYNVFKNELEIRGITFIQAGGSFQEREKRINSVIREISERLE